MNDVRYRIDLVRCVREDRWFHRVILRRKWRSKIVFSGIPQNLGMTRSLNAVSHVDYTLAHADEQRLREAFQ